ncbi:MAG: transcriptional repressor LexA [Rubrobacteraceae bacterium]
MLELHPRRVDILKFLARREGGEPPTVAEIAGAVGLRSTQTAHHHLGRLEEGGYFERGAAPSRKRRPVSITERGWEVLGSAPALGRVAAGRGLEAVADEELYSLTQLLRARDGGRRYLLRSVGQSMTGAGIEDGDLLIVEEDEDPPDGTVVVAMLDGGEEVTVKRLYREGEMVRLRAHNGNHEDIVAHGDQVKVQGRVEYVFHPPRR